MNYLDDIKYWSQVFSLSKNDAIRIAIEQRNKAQSCKDLNVKKEWIEKICSFEKHFKIGNEEGDTEVGFDERVKALPILKASMFDLASFKNRR